MVASLAVQMVVSKEPSMVGCSAADSADRKAAWKDTMLVVLKVG